ncbi:vitellogenin-like [Rhinoraja longicauda]
MKSLIFLLALALVGSDHVSKYDPNFTENRLHIYRYEGVILSGLPERGLNQAGVRLVCKVKIRSVGQRQYLLQIEEPRIQELNGVWPKDPFTSAKKLTERLAPLLTKAVKFEYVNGRVGTIFAPTNLPEDILNIHRGILNIFQITIKKAQSAYDLQEAGIEGICHARYLVQEDKRKERVTIIKSKDLNNCQERVVKHTGMAYTELCPSCQLRGKNIRASVTFTHVLKPTAAGAILQEAKVREVHQFTPFHELDGTLRVETRQSLILEQITTATVTAVPDLQSQRSLQFRSDRSVLQQPFMLTRDQNIILKVKDILSHIAKNNVQNIHSDAPSRFLELIQLLRSSDHSSLVEVWRMVKNQPELRRWFIEALPAVGTIDSLKCVKSHIQESEISGLEILQTLLLAMHQVKTDRQVMSVANEIINLSMIKDTPFLRKATLLAYGSMVFRFCAERSTCSDDVLKPLHNLLAEATSQRNEEIIVLGLKAIGNAGQPASIKSIVKLLPSFGTVSSNLPLKIRVDAIMALRNIVRKDPKTVQRIAVQIFLNRKNHPEERMMACAVLFLTKPPLTLVSMVANSLLTETSLQVASFTHSHIRALSRSSLPGIYSLATSCNLALNILSPKLEQLGHRFSKVYRADTFMYRVMAGISAKALLIKSSSTIIPTALMAKVRGHAMGGEMDLIQVGLRAEGLQEVITKTRSSDIKITENRSIRRILSKIVNWKDFPEEEILGSAYVRVFGQELAFVQIRKDTIDQIGQFMTAPLSSQWRSYLQQLNKGISFQPAKAIMAAEVRRVVPTAVGLPMELNLIATGLAVAKGNIEVRSEPAISRLPQLLTSKIQLRARLTPSVAMHIRAFMGINMRYIRSGVSLHTNVRTTIPVDVITKINLKEGNLRIDTTPAQKENKIVSIDSQVYTVSRNIENLSTERRLPILPQPTRRDISSQQFRSSAQSGRVSDESSVTQVAPETLADQIPCSGEDQRPRFPNRAAYRACMRADKVGVQACIDARMENAVSIRHIPLYRLIGKHQLNVTLIPVSSAADIETIVLEIQTGAKSLTKMIKLNDKESKMEHIPSAMDPDSLGRILIKQAQRNSTLSRYSSSSSSSSSSRASRATSLSKHLSGRKTSLRAGSSSSISSSSSSSSSSSRKSSRLSKSLQRSSIKSSSGPSMRRRIKMSSSSRRRLRGSTRRSGSLRSSSMHWSSSTRPSERASRQIMELRFKSAHSSGYTVRRQSGQGSRSISQRSSSRLITRASRSSPSKSRPSRHSSSILRSSTQRYLVSNAGSPLLVVLLRARRTDGVQQGYQITGYGKLSSRIPRMHLRLVDLQPKSNWKMCADALLPSSHKLLTLARWGENCQRYRVAVTVSTGQLASHPATKVKMQWSRINENLKYGGKMVGDYLPGLAYSLGLSQSYRRNRDHQITVLVALTSPRTIDTIIRLPKMTAFYQGLPIPTSLPVHAVSKRVEDVGFRSIAELAETFLKMNQRECVAENETVWAFDGNQINHNISNDCFYVLTQDCSDSPKFMLLMKRAQTDKTKKSIKLILSVKNTTIEAIPLSDRIQILVNGIKQAPEQQILPNIVNIERNKTGITLRIPSVNIDKLYFDGERVQIVLDQMMGKTCGICGLNNDEKKMVMPSREVARDQEHLFESWLCPGSSCKDDCKVRRDFVELGTVVEFEGQASRCYSVEPIQRCLAECTPMETRSRLLSFHCLSANYTVTDMSLFNKKLADMSRSVDSHTDCMCRCSQ